MASAMAAAVSIADSDDALCCSASVSYWSLPCLTSSRCATAPANVPSAVCSFGSSFSISACAVFCATGSDASAAINTMSSIFECKVSTFFFATSTATAASSTTTSSLAIADACSSASNSSENEAYSSAMDFAMSAECEVWMVSTAVSAVSTASSATTTACCETCSCASSVSTSSVSPPEVAVSIFAATSLTTALASRSSSLASSTAVCAVAISSVRSAAFTPLVSSSTSSLALSSATLASACAWIA
mmetsp:Transcript_9257/g.34544  ORF Transcript_9257/g.34544 Transcript_9257/m.34544 type:complete len:246 (-) Transcript_9257:4197-4934(-)